MTLTFILEISWLAEQEDQGSIPCLATWIFRDWLSPASSRDIAEIPLKRRKSSIQPTTILEMSIFLPPVVSMFHKNNLFQFVQILTVPTWFCIMLTYKVSCNGLRDIRFVVDYIYVVRLDFSKMWKVCYCMQCLNCLSVNFVHKW